VIVCAFVPQIYYPRDSFTGLSLLILLGLRDGGSRVLGVGASAGLQMPRYSRSCCVAF